MKGQMDIDVQYRLNASLISVVTGMNYIIADLDFW